MRELIYLLLVRGNVDRGGLFSVADATVQCGEIGLYG